MMDRKVFRELMSVEDAKRILKERFPARSVGVEDLPLEQVAGRVLAEDVEASMDVPPFDRASMDGFAVQAEDTFGAEEDRPVNLRIVDRVGAGDIPTITVGRSEVVEISTGAPIPKGANAVVMVEYTWQDDGLKIYRAVVPGENIMAAGADIMAGELILRAGDLLTPRETGVLAALGRNTVKVHKRPIAAILSTGNEIVSPGSPLTYGKLYDINARTISDAVAENGGTPRFYGIVGDRREEMQTKIEEALREADMVITSGGTSAGVGDLLYKVINDLGPPGILVHGISVKPGKPAIMGIAKGKPIFGLPGYPASALMIFNIFICPVLRQMAGLAPEVENTVVEACAAEKIFSSGGRREYMPVNVVKTRAEGYAVYPVPGESGAITTLAEADGFVEVPETRLFFEAGEKLLIQLFSRRLKPADLMIIGSNCVGIDVILSHMRSRGIGFKAKVISTGSSGGLVAIRRGEADIAGTHLLDEETGIYNIPFLNKFEIADKAILVRGYNREQGLLVAKGNPKKIQNIQDLCRRDVSIINRNQGSGTRILLDMKLAALAKTKNTTLDSLTRTIIGYKAVAKSHSAVAVSVLQRKADVGLTIRAVAESYGLHFIRVAEEKYDFLIHRERYEKTSVQAFLETLRSEAFKEELPRRVIGLSPDKETGKVLWPSDAKES